MIASRKAYILLSSTISRQILFNETQNANAFFFGLFGDDPKTTAKNRLAKMKDPSYEPRRTKHGNGDDKKTLLEIADFQLPEEAWKDFKNQIEKDEQDCYQDSDNNLVLAMINRDHFTSKDRSFCIDVLEAEFKKQQRDSEIEWDGQIYINLKVCPRGVESMMNSIVEYQIYVRYRIPIPNVDNNKPILNAALFGSDDERVAPYQTEIKFERTFPKDVYWRSDRNCFANTQYVDRNGVEHSFKPNSTAEELQEVLLKALPQQVLKSIGGTKKLVLTRESCIPKDVKSALTCSGKDQFMYDVTQQSIDVTDIDRRNMILSTGNLSNSWNFLQVFVKACDYKEGNWTREELWKNFAIDSNIHVEISTVHTSGIPKPDIRQEFDLNA